MNNFGQVHNQWSSYWQFQEYVRAWQLTQQRHSNYPTSISIPKVSYSQAASASRSRKPRNFISDTAIFPPLPKEPHPHHKQADVSYAILPTDLVGGYNQPSHTPPQKAPIKLDFDDTTLSSFVDWTDGKILCLPPNVASAIGLDLWLYQLRGKDTPTVPQETSLRNRILQLANESPLTLHQAIENRELKKLLGRGFEWVECPSVW